MDNITAKLSFFPLGISVLPGEEVKLHIFEPRYIQLIQDCNSESMTFGIPFIKGTKIAGFGTEVKLKRVLKVYSNGTMDIQVEGLQAFRVLNYISSLPDKLYSGGEIELIQGDKSVESERLLGLFKEYNIKAHNSSIIYSFINPLSVYEMASVIGLRDKQKYKLMSMSDKEEQESYLLNQVRYLLLILEQESRTENDFYLN